VVQIEVSEELTIQHTYTYVIDIQHMSLKNMCLFWNIQSRQTNNKI